MASPDVHIGWDGNCKDHTTQPTIIRDAGGTALLQHLKCGRPILGKVSEVHCAAGHKYLCVDRVDFIHDPFEDAEEKELVRRFTKEIADEK